MSLATLSAVGALLADQTRCRLLQALMDSRAWTAGELARFAGVTPSTVSEHLSRLLDADFIAMEAQGRHRYFRLAGPPIAQVIESLGALELPAADRGSHVVSAPAELRYARSCYDHLAGRLGVDIYDRLLTNGHLRRSDSGVAIQPSGEDLFAGLGVDIDAVRRANRPSARSCLDWTERRHHLAGAAATALLQVMLERRWLTRGSRPRSILVTEAGRRGLEAFMMECPAPA
ncbi:winged helix-turn-helix domain-containing protein [Acidiferrimicrobium sp. IK]|uniref:ArsR/SmtB family transcription factor n=1 Tax=Acidiferrimicrobium sp. IK TaxID=2871700 RepID=UPI0021CB3633|nr:winged helix-turn-helix domain-containing protein [Acidiferrimicrobium sp. IK]MCU4187014.1 winged helix-turn-helix domain-containing protein [Acidiferrimicrobium sp. IK]